MARKTKTLRTAGRRKKTTLPSQESTASLDAVEVAQAVLDLLDLSYQCLTVEQRGRTSLAEKDFKVLREVMGRLAHHRDAHAAKEVGRKIQVLTPHMQALGWLRRSLDDLCRYAVKQPASDARDKVLANEMELCFIGALAPWRIERKHVDEAVSQVKRRATERAKYDRPGGRPKDWLRLTKESDNRESALTAAGELLRVVVKLSGAKLDASLSVSSTADYAKKVVIQLRARSARRVMPLARLGYLMTVLGVPVETVPWAAWQVSRALAGENLLARLPTGALSFTCPDPGPPVPFRLLDTAAKELIVEALHRRLVEAGFSEDQLMDVAARNELATRGHEMRRFTGSRLWGVVDSFIDSPSAWAGEQVSEELPAFLARPNPWARKSS